MGWPNGTSLSMSRMWARVLPLFSPAVSLNNVVRLLCDCEMTDSNLSQLSVSFLSNLLIYQSWARDNFIHNCGTINNATRGHSQIQKQICNSNSKLIFDTIFRRHLLGFTTVIYGRNSCLMCAQLCCLHLQSLFHHIL